MKVRKIIQVICIGMMVVSLYVYNIDAYSQYLDNIFRTISLPGYVLCQIGFLSSYFAFILYHRKIINNILYALFAMIVVIFLNLFFLCLKSSYAGLGILSILIFLVFLLITERKNNDEIKGKLRKQTTIEWIKYISILMIVAVIIGVVMAAFIFIMKDNFHLYWSWIALVWFSLVSIMIANYEGYPLIRKKKKIVLLGLLNGLLTLEIAFMFLLFYFKVLEFPDKHPFVYSFVFAGMGLFTVEIFSAIVDKIGQKKTKKSLQ